MQNFLNFDKHMREMKSIVDTSAPRDYSHITNSHSGRSYMQKRMKREEIARGNSLLIEQLYSIHKKRKREIDKINIENKAFLQALQRTKSVYRTDDLAKFQKNVRSYRKRISHSRMSQMRPLVTPRIAQSVQSLEAVVSSQGWNQERKQANHGNSRPRTSSPDFRKSRNSVVRRSSALPRSISFYDPVSDSPGRLNLGSEFK